MRNRSLLATLAVICASSAASAADLSQAINPLNAAGSLMESCAGIANRISSMPAPAGFKDSIAAGHFNEVTAAEFRKAHPPKAAGGKPDEINPALLKPIPPEHLAFMAGLTTLSGELKACGEKYAISKPKTDELMKQTLAALKDPKNSHPVPTVDDKKLTQALTNYMVSGQKLSAAVTALSRDQVHQLYLADTIQKYFLGRSN